MTMFEYRALDASGKMLVGTMEASTADEVSAHLDRAGATPVSMREKRSGGERTWRDRLTIDPGSEEITGFTVDLAMLLKGGVTLGEALLILTQMETRRWLVRLIQQLHVDIAGGKSQRLFHKHVLAGLYRSGRPFDMLRRGQRDIDAVDAIAGQQFLIAMCQVCGLATGPVDARVRL